MKLVREHINEKFTDESDPIRDLNIGLKSKLTPYQWDKIADIMRLPQEDERKMYKFFNLPSQDIYWLGDTSINEDKQKYFRHINKIIKEKTLDKAPRFSADMILRKMGKFMPNVITGYNTSEGKILTQEYQDSGRIQTTYFGDLKAAFSVQVVQNKIYDDL
jgi:hypothetical protein